MTQHFSINTNLKSIYTPCQQKVQAATVALKLLNKKEQPSTSHTMSLTNVYHVRRVADTSAKACLICYKPSTSVMITPDNKVRNLVWGLPYG